MNTMEYLYDTKYDTTDEEPQDPIYDFDVAPYGWGELNMGLPKNTDEEE